MNCQLSPCQELCPTNHPLLSDLASACSNLFAVTVKHYPSPPSSPTPHKTRRLSSSSSSSASSVGSVASSFGAIVGLRHEAGRLREWTELLKGMDVELFGGGEDGDRLFLEPVIARVAISMLNMTAQLEYLLVEAGVVAVAGLPEVQDMRYCIGDFLSILRDTAAMNDAEAAVLAAARVNTVSRDIAVAVEDLAEMNNSLWSLTTALTLRASAPNELSRPRRARTPTIDAPTTTHTDRAGPGEARLRRRDSRTRPNDKYSRPDDPLPSQDEKTYFLADINIPPSKSCEKNSKPPRTYTYLARPRKPQKPPTSRTKAVLIGTGYCGKTSVISSFTTHKFSPIYVPTTFADHLTHAGSLHNVEMTVIDTAGLEEYDRLRPLSYPDADAVVWLPEYHHFTPTVPLIVAGLKSDLRHEDTPTADEKSSRGHALTPVSYAQGLHIAKAAGAIAYVECSAKSGHGVRKAFNIIADLAAGWKEKREERRKESCTVM